MKKKASILIGDKKVAETEHTPTPEPSELEKESEGFSSDTIQSAIKLILTWVIIIGCAVVIIIMLTSCEKESTHCWQCEVKKTNVYFRNRTESEMVHIRDYYMSKDSLLLKCHTIECKESYPYLEVK